MTSNATEWTEQTWAERHSLVYTAQMNRLYHHKRERFFAVLDRSGKALSLITGTAAASTLLDTADAKAAAGLMVAAFTLPGLVFAWADKARSHGELAAEYTRIESDIIAAGPMDYKQIDQFHARLTETSAKEPPGLSALLRLCQNELAASENQPDKIFPLRWYERLLAHWLDFPLQRIGH